MNATRVLRSLLLLVALSWTAWAVRAEGGPTWAEKLQHPGSSSVHCARTCSDGQYVLAGYAQRGAPNEYDGWVAKLDTAGGVVWSKYYGGDRDDSFRSIRETSDGGYIVVGKTCSFGTGNDAYSWQDNGWVLKLDANGGIVWEEALGAWQLDQLYSVVQTFDGGYLAAGWSESFDAPEGDAWLIKLDPSGVMQWQRTYGGAGDDELIALERTTDGGYVAAGDTNSSGAGGTDMWVLKLTSAYAVEWQRTYGSTRWEGPAVIQQTNDGGYILVGAHALAPPGLDMGDALLLKLDATGQISWHRQFGTAYTDHPDAIREAVGGGYLVAGYIEDLTQYIVPYRGFLTKLDPFGTVSWYRSYGLEGSLADERFQALDVTSDGGIVAAGESAADAFVLQLSSSGLVDETCKLHQDLVSTSTPLSITSSLATGHTWHPTNQPSKSSAQVDSADIKVDVLCGGTTEAPIITSIKSKTAKHGTPATIQGSGFSSEPGQNQVYFGTMKAKVSKARTTSLKVTIPKKAPAGSVDVFVVVNGVSSNSVAFVIK